MPDTVGVPVMVMVLAAHVEVTPAGNPVDVPIPVAYVVVWVIGVNNVLIHNVGVLEAAVTLFKGFTTTLIVVGVAFVQPLVVAGSVSK